MPAIDFSTRAVAWATIWVRFPSTTHASPRRRSWRRYRARTLEAYRYDLRVFFQWAADHGLDVLAATRPQIELYVGTTEEPGLAASTIDRRLSTVCGLYRFAHIEVGSRRTPPPLRTPRRPTSSEKPSAATCR